MGTHDWRYEPGQPFLPPPSPCGWLPENHLAYCIADTLDQLNLSALHKRYQGDGRRNGGGKAAAHGENESSAGRSIRGKQARLRAKAIQSK